ncbi:MAG: N-6 DNA methylase [Patescibacteria group bacterium]|nr:N-6 DNA methylase [Patescibacteria group bacterium]
MNNQKQKDLGIFYTPKIVVNFIFQMLLVMKNKEDQDTERWQSHKPTHYPSVIDPACGEGIFLKTAVTSDFTGYHPVHKTPYIFGIDIDGEVVKRWEEISILHDLFKADKKKMLDHFHQQDGLLELPQKVFSYKKGGLKEFDAVVGNPPYGGMGFSSLKDKNTKESINILEHLKSFNILGYKKRSKKTIDDNQKALWGEATWGSQTWGGNSTPPPNIKDVESIAIEILFIDRFIQLAKQGGFIAIIIPDGILANSTYHYVRQFIAEKTKVVGIVSLPRETFKQEGTNAKTSILILQKETITDFNYTVFLASTEKLLQGNFDTILAKFKEFYDK